VNKKLKTVSDIVQWRLCVGCGVCASVCPEHNVRLVDLPDEGIRPLLVDPGRCGSCDECLRVCPGYEYDNSEQQQRIGIIEALSPYCGPVLELWEGHASDPEIRFHGSSGGALTALSLYCLEKKGMDGVLHIGQDPDDSIRNKTRLSRSRAELLACSGSRYAPASACDRLDLIENAGGPCVFVGQPSEIVALRKAQRFRPALAGKVGVALSFFCAGSPSTRGTSELLNRLGIDPSSLSGIRYRGNGWPGSFAATPNGQSTPACEMSYRESWGFLQKFRPYSSHLWPDGTGEAADISCGDPWYRDVTPGEPGSSLLVVRTPAGREIIKGAIETGYLVLTAAEPWKLLRSQENLVNRRRVIWGRRLAFRAFGLPLTKLKGFPLFRLWLGLSFKEKLKSIFGTARRIISRRYFRPLKNE